MISFKNGSLVCERYILGPMEVNTYLVYDENSNQALLVDPAEESQQILQRIAELDLKELTILLTHGHADHIYGVEFFRQQLKAPVAISEEDSTMLTDASMNLSCYLGDSIELSPAERLLKDGEKIELGGQIGELRHVPGHTPGSMILVFDHFVLSGDTLFAGSIGRSDFPGGDGKVLVDAIKRKIFSLSDRIVLPGHGPETTIKEEKNSNPFFGTLFNI
jgi:glyoxylase-like metal-dependent hydrolase (beta-lactamase superfamily II)